MGQVRAVALTALLQRAIIVAAALAMLLFALPLAVAVSGLYRGQALAELARDAEQARAVLGDRQLADPQRIAAALPRPQAAGTQVAVYVVEGGRSARVAGGGPGPADQVVREAARTGVEESGRDAGWLVAAVPLPNDDDERPQRFVVRAAQPFGQVQRQVYLTWAGMLVLGLIILAVVVALARTRARRIARPLQQVAAMAAALGQGDFSVRAVPAGVVEVDAVAGNLERTARRLGAVLERERAFSADASHQLRSPLTAVRVGLESALLTPGADLRGAAHDALEGLDRLERTVLDLLALARDTSTGGQVTPVAAVVAEAVAAWRRRLADAGRRLDLVGEEALPPAGISEPALRTVIDVLLDDSLTHGAGTVTVGLRGDEDAVVLEVGDAGAGVSGDPARLFVRRSPDSRGTGIGLALARSLVEADGGRLELTNRRPAVFAVILPVRPDPMAGRSGSRSRAG